MAAMFKRPRPAGGRHPPPLAPTVSSFKPRAQWTNSGSSIFLYVNLPGFYSDQIVIKRDERTRTVQIQGQRPLSAQTKARFNESYRVPETCDMTKWSTSFSHGLLTIEFPAIVEGDKKEKAVHDQGKNGQRSNEEKSSPNGSTLARKKPLNEEKQAGTSKEKATPTLNEEKPKTYKSVVESKREVPTGSREKSEPKVQAGEAIPNVRGKESPKEEKVVERKEAAQMGQQKIIQKLKEEEAKRSPTLGTSTLKPKVRAIEEEVKVGKKDADLSQNKTGQMVKEKEIIRKSPAVDASLGPKVQAKLVEKKGDGEIGQKLKEGGKINVGQKEQRKYTKPVVGDEARRTEKKTNQPEPELKPKEGDERTELDVDDGLINKQDEKREKVGDIVSEGEIEEIVEPKKIEETGSAKDTGDHKDNAEVVKPETGPLLAKEGQTKTNMDPPPTVGVRGMGEEESRTYDISLVNVGAAALVIMGFGAYVFVPLVKYFS
ncbi:PREDICTED: protein RESTRICTED TEV MOVEMENT 2-like [Camelina sativa]|uniref:Protein RESTRICTED TEV MOVEMENT 2-like n=1 Tax=Camelina sativa TaxID=90675 RepID=A0ABM0W2G8_CAMSA|nr:PREDICTED: protein RESTRICTED TEV MOVEMENT 2-like [Camelina sativa]